MNAFDMLGLDSTATQQQIHQAYRTRVKQCHPDQFSDGEMQKKAQEQLVKLNLAYAEALRLSASVKTEFRGAPVKQVNQVARKLLEQGRYESALLQLSRADIKDGEWYFLQGQLLLKMKQFASAHQSFREAVRQEPDNREYRAGALDAAVALKKHQKLPYKMLDWAEGVLHPRKRT